MYVPGPSAKHFNCEKRADMRWDPMPSARDLAPTAFKDWEVLGNEASVAVDAPMLSLITGRIEVMLGGAT